MNVHHPWVVAHKCPEYILGNFTTERHLLTLPLCDTSVVPYTYIPLSMFAKHIPCTA